MFVHSQPWDVGHVKPKNTFSTLAYRTQHTLKRNMLMMKLVSWTYLCRCMHSNGAIVFPIYITIDNCWTYFCILLLIYDAVHNDAITSQQCCTSSYCMVILHACIPDQQHGIHGIRQANPRFTGCIIRIIELNTHCATSDVNPFKIRCNLQITKETVNETQWWHFINDVSNDVNISHWCHSETSGQKNLHMMID